jgi:hypothetical protein
MRVSFGRIAGFVLISLAAWSAHAQVPSDAELDRLEAQVVRAENVEAIKRLTHIFGYLRDKFYDDEMLELFTDDAVVDFKGGKYIGKESVRRLFTGPRYKPQEAVGRQGPQPGIINDHILMQHVITLSDDGLSARARWKEWAQRGVHGVRQTYLTGVYENTYRKVDGVWRISAMAYCTRFETPYLLGIFEREEPPAFRPVPTFYPQDPLGPDKQSNYACHEYPHVGVNPPMHYPHPVTGDWNYKP